MITTRDLQLTQFFQINQTILSTENQVIRFLAIQPTKRLDIQKFIAQAKRRKMIREARGSLSHVPGGVETFLRNKREDIEQEQISSSPTEVGE